MEYEQVYFVCFMFHFYYHMQTVLFIIFSSPLVTSRVGASLFDLFHLDWSSPSIPILCNSLPLPAVHPSPFSSPNTPISLSSSFWVIAVGAVQPCWRLQTSMFLIVVCSTLSSSSTSFFGESIIIFHEAKYGVQIILHIEIQIEAF